MDSGTGRKRPCEPDRPIDPHSKRRLSPTAAGERLAPLLPRHAGFYAPEGEPPSPPGRRLPPLYTPTCTASAERLTLGALAPSSPDASPPGLDRTRPRTQSLFDVLLQHPERDQEGQSGPERTETLPVRPEFNRTFPPPRADLQHSRLATALAPHTPAGALICCTSDCSGQVCSNTRTLMRKLAAELSVLDANVTALLRTDRSSFTDLPPAEHSSAGDSLQWALETVQWANQKLRDVSDIQTSQLSGLPSAHTDPSTTTMRRTHPHHDREDHSPGMRQLQGPPGEHARFTYPPAVIDDGRRNPNPYGGEMGLLAHSPLHSASPSGSGFIPPQSPMQAPQPSRPGLLPSPSSMNFQNVPNLPPISSPASSLQNSAQTAHMQDLQHQISVKTLAFQTLQREYDSLLQKLERQRTKCATLEKKFEVSDFEINGLTDEKERLQAQVASMENQVEELQQSRDEARRQLVANGTQYMRIMEMANRLQAQSLEDKKRWEAEKAELEQRIRVLEEAMVTGAERHPSSSMDESDSTSLGATVASSSSFAVTVAAAGGTANQNRNQFSSSVSVVSAASATETINVLRTEISRLRSRTQVLETALRTMREESISIQAAAKQMVESGARIERAADGAS